jgi:hypothetical protein
MRYITLKQAAQRLALEEQVLLQWVEQGVLNAYLPMGTQHKPYRHISSKQLLAYMPAPEVYFAADDIEEIAEDMAWSRIGRKHLWDEDEDS